MMHSTEGHRDNLLLAALPVDLLQSMKSDLHYVSFVQGQLIYEPGAPIKDIYFPQTGMISLLIVAKNGSGIETGIVGREGAVGLHGAMGNRVSFIRATTQVGGRFSTIRVGAFAQFAHSNHALRDMIARQTEALWAEAQQTAACNTIHQAPARLCRWLLQCADSIGSYKLLLTQELLAQILGVRRTTVTILAQSLKSDGVIDYARGHITILDRQKLEHCACECYGAIRRLKLSMKYGVETS